MDFNEYQDWTDQTAIYPEGLDGLWYVGMGIASEAGEVAGKLKKILRDGDSPELREKVFHELGDVLWYAARVAAEMQWPLEAVARANREKLESRKERGVIGGSGDNR